MIPIKGCCYTGEHPKVKFYIVSVEYYCLRLCACIFLSSCIPLDIICVHYSNLLYECIVLVLYCYVMVPLYHLPLYQ